MKPVIIDNGLSIGATKTAVIAEIGINHNGDSALARDMIEIAWECGADLIKLQSFVTEKFFIHDLPYFRSAKALELTLEMQRDLLNFAAHNGIRLFTTPFDIDTLDFLDEFDLPAYKVASMDCNNYQLIESIARRQKPVILSTGMALADEIEKAVQVIKGTGNQQIVLLHCVSDYPPEAHDMNLNYIHTLQQKFNVPCGFSDHTAGMDAALLSVGLGACIIEKHFTMDRGLHDKFPQADHKVSMIPSELKELSSFCRQAELIKGGMEKHLTEKERQGRLCFRRGIYTKVAIDAGEILTAENLISLRPVRGIPVSMFNHVLGKKTVRSFKEKESLCYEGVEGMQDLKGDNL